MKSRADFYFQTSVNLLLATGFFTLASTGKVDLPSMLCFAAAYTAYVVGGFRRRVWLLSAGRVSFFSKIYILVFLLDLWWLSKSFVDAAIHLLIFIQILKFFSEKKDRDYFYMILIAFMELLAAAAMTISPSFSVAFLVFLALVISSLMSFEIKRSQELYAERRSHPPRGETSSLARSGNGTRRLYGALAAASAIMSLGIVAFAALFFFALPRVEAGFFTRLNTNTQSITGFSSLVQFGAVGSLKKNMAVVMRVRVEGDPRDFDGVKWRGIALNWFEGNSWRRKTEGDTKSVLKDGRGGYRLLPEQVPPPHRLVQYQILLEPISTEVLFAAARARLVLTSARLRMDTGETLSTDYHPYSRVRYNVISDIAPPWASSLRKAGTEYPPNFEEDYLSLPEFDRRIHELARNITRAETNNYDRARSVESYLKENYGYTLDLPSTRELDPVGQFLFESRRGHCEYFASSMAILLRTLGIPSRVVNGFQTGEYNAVGKDFIVREADAHSWVEVFFPGYGWVAFDPTPAVIPPHRSAAWVALNHYLDALELFWINWIVGFDSFRQIVLFQGLQNGTLAVKYGLEQLWLTWTTRLSDFYQATFLSPQASLKRSQLLTHLGQKFLWGLGLLAVFAGPWAIGRFVRHRRLLRSPRPHLVAEVFSKWLRALARRGFDRHPCQTPLEFSQSISDARLRSSAIELATLYNRLRFDPSRLDAQAYLSFRSRLQMEIKNL
jgi:transglutaminase-like putative cysteine protease